MTFVLGLAFVGVVYVGIFKINGPQVYEESQSLFRLRVTRQKTFDFNYRYTFESSSGSSEDWRPVYSHVQDDPVQVSDNQIRILNEHTGYLVMGNTFAVTVDGGANWKFFIAEKDANVVKDRQGYGLIDRVEMSSDGSGKLTLHPESRIPSPPQFETADFGQTWKEK